MFNSDPNNKDSLLEDIVEVGALTAGVPAYAYLNNKYQGSSFQETLRNYGSKLPGSDYLNNQMNRVISTTSGQVLSTAEQSLQKTFLSQLMMLEEMSPLHILRTLQLSNLVQPFTELSNNNEMIHISGRAVRNQEYYYRSLIDYVNKDNERKIKRSLQTNDLVRGMFYQNGKIYGATKEGLLNKDDLIMRDAKLVLSSVKNGEIYSANHVLEKFANVIGSKINKEGSKIDPITIVAGKSSKDFGLNWGKSTLRFSMEVGFKTLDNPIAGIEEMLHGVGANYTGVFQSKTWQTAKRYTNINFGTGGRYDLGTRESLKISAKNVALKGAGLYLGYEVLDSAVRTLSGEGGLFDNGLASGLANIYASSRIAFAEVWSDRFQGYKEKQEQNAPGSTDLTKLLAFPLGGALLGAQLSYFSRVGVASTKGTEKAASIFNVESESKFLKNFGIDTKLKPMKKNALIGGLVGAAFTLPFLPGALIGSSSDELRDLYSGKTDVAEKSNRFWSFGGGAWEGGATKFFTKNWVARLNADATDKVRYGDDDTKKKLNPFLHPFSYLRDPYKFEKLNAESMPYPVWGLDVAYGGIFGKVFEKTIGQVIKPDVINPAIYDANQQQVTTVSEPSLLGKILGIRREGSEEVKELGESVISNLLETDTKVNTNLSAKDKSLVMNGLFTQPAEARYQPLTEATGLTYKHLTDFTGIKGWSSSLMLGSLGLDPDVVNNQLARSGEAESSARDLVDQNMGDLLGLGEFQRKILPTSSGAIAERVNPIANNMASWLPSDSATYYKNFAVGNPYDKVARGEERLPGVGFAALNPELQGVDPEDYSLVYKLKVLSDVARGSKEHRDAREQALAAYNEGQLSNREIDILGTTLDQEQQIQQKKDFYTKPYGNLKGPIGSFQSNLWESMRTNSESPLEMLTPIRPIAKFLHQRTAIEDYIETQLGGPDAAIWTNPYSHFIKPALNKSRQSFDIGNKVFIPEETREKYNIDEYFDKFDYIRKRMQGADNYALSTVIGSSLSGLNTKDKVLQFKSALSDDQKDYFDQFSKETNEKRRAMIRAMLPDDVRRGYEQIWQNVDIAQRAKGKGASVQQAIADNFHNQTEKLKDAYNVSLSKDEKTRAIAKVNSDKDTYANLGMSKSDRIKYAEDEALRLKMADREALTYVNNRTGLPSKGFIGWDPRLKTDDIKIKSLSIGGEDLRRFGFWKKDEERMRQLDAITEQSGQVFTQIDDIKRSIRSERAMKMGIERTMFDRGFKVTNINFVDSDHGSLLIKENSN